MAYGKSDGSSFLSELVQLPEDVGRIQHIFASGISHILPEHIFSERKRILNQQAGLSEKYC